MGRGGEETRKKGRGEKRGVEGRESGEEVWGKKSRERSGVEKR